MTFIYGVHLENGILRADRRMKRLGLTFSLFVSIILLVGCIALPFIPLVFSGAGAAYQGYTVWRGTESSKYYSCDFQNTCSATKQSVDKMGLEIVSFNSIEGKECSIETKGNNHLIINVLSVEKTVSKVMIKIEMMGDRQFAEFVYKNIDDLLVVKPDSRQQEKALAEPPKTIEKTN
jgi:Protein of unknown function (DUF3568)